MTKNRRPPLRLEAFECRIAPAVTRAIGTLQIVDTTIVPTDEWASGAANVLGNVIGTHVLKGSIDVSYTLTGEDLDVARKIGHTILGEEVKWMSSGPLRMVSGQRFAVSVPKGAAFPMLVDVKWSDSTTNDQQKNAAGTS